MRKCQWHKRLIERLLLTNARRIHTQKRDDKNKLYSLHAPEVECIAKGKAHKKYEFGSKTSVATTANSNWIVATDAHHGNLYDGATLKPTIDQIKRLTGARPKMAIVDRGYRGINALLSGCGFNLRKLLRAFSCALQNWLSEITFKRGQSFCRSISGLTAN